MLPSQSKESLSARPGAGEKQTGAGSVLAVAPIHTRSFMQLTCSCGRKYWPTQRWIHEKCATNRIATNAEATNKAVSLDERAAEAVRRARDQVVAGDAKAESAKTRNRRAREAYNAYQREYMRKRRAK